MLDSAFEAAFRHMFVYNILFEDAEVDGRYFEINEDSRVLGISAAGCGLASMVRFRPAHIDAVDINPHHLALAALKMVGARDIDSYDHLYQMFGFGQVQSSEVSVRALSAALPEWTRAYWKKHHGRFKTSLYGEGLTALMFRGLRRHAGLGSAWMKDFVKKDISERVQAVRELVEPKLRHPLVSGVLRSPLNQLALGVNFAQRDRMLPGSGDILEFILSHLSRVAETDCETNWFAWQAVAGHYNHDHPDAFPPYLRKSCYESSRGAPTSFDFHRESILSTLRRARSNTWTHYSLCDAVDWMSKEQQDELFTQIIRTAQPGARVLVRSVSSESAVAEWAERDRSGLSRSLVHLEEASHSAAREDRSRQYQRVDFYQVCA